MRRTGKYVLLGVAAMLSVLGVTGVTAYFLDADEMNNRLTVGYNDVEITEEFPDPNPTPGGEVKKIVKFSNTGDVPCYVRAKLVFSNGEAEEISVMDLNRADWIEEDDGYYYYKKVLPVGGQTESLLTAVKIAEDVEIEELVDWDLYVYVETVQSAGYDTPQDAFAHLEK